MEENSKTICMIIWIFFVFSSVHAQNEKTVSYRSCASNVDQEFAATILSVLILVEMGNILSEWKF